MATKVSGKKATGTRKRKERKNIERGAVHIQSTFNNTIVTIPTLRATLFPGQVPAKWASEAQENLLPLLLRLLQRQLPRLLWSTV